MEKPEGHNSGILSRAVTRRQAIKAGGIAAVGLAFSKPLIETIYPKPAFANYVTNRFVGCTPGFWQGGRGSKLWNETNDPDWAAERLAGGSPFNPFVHNTLFNDFFDVETISGLDGFTMLDLVGTGGGSYWPQKTARDVVAAYLNASFGFNYGLTTGQIAVMWYAAVEEFNDSGSTNKLESLHNQLDTLNNNGDCLDDEEAV